MDSARLSQGGEGEEMGTTLVSRAQKREGANISRLYDL